MKTVRKDSYKPIGMDDPYWDTHSDYGVSKKPLPRVKKAKTKTGYYSRSAAKGKPKILKTATKGDNRPNAGVAYDSKQQKAPFFPRKNRS